MAIRKYIAAAGACSLAACAAVPPHPEYDGIKVEHIVDAVQCELASVYRKSRYAKSMRNWLARVTLELKVTNDATVAPTVTVAPNVLPNALTIPVGPDLEDQTVRNAVLTFDVHMRDIDPTNRRVTPNRMPPCPYEYSGLPQAAARLGLAEWVATIADASGRPDFAALYDAAYNLEFVIVRGVHGGLTFTAPQITVDTTGGSIKKTNYNHLNVVFKDDPMPSVKGRKKTASPGISQQLDFDRQRFLGQRLILQQGSGRLTQ